MRQLLLLTLLALFLGACSTDSPSGPLPVALVTVTPPADTLLVGDTVRFSAVLRDERGGLLLDRPLVWSSTDSAVASVDSIGLVRGVGPGAARVAATSESVRGEAEVTVSATPAPGLALELVAQGLSSPVHLTAPPGDTTRLFIVEQTGRVRVVRNGQLLAAPFLDVSGEITAGGERGLLSLAFHPGYAANGRLFVFLTDTGGDTRVVEYRVGASADVADAGSARLILAVDQPFSNHNGGLIAFGPDGHLYVGLGDGGSGGDPLGHGQNLGTLLGSLLRIDVDGGDPYGIPSDNPFVGVAGARGEIWAWGLRNPWRFAFDRVTGELYLADVGQNRWEEVNVGPGGGRGVNYGWNVMEGETCFNAASCDRTGLTLPVYQYSHDTGGCSVTGGLVYRGSRIPSLSGTYFFADYCQGWIRSFRWVAGVATAVRDWTDELGRPGRVSSFGEDEAGELYVVVHEGRVYRVVEGGDELRSWQVDA